MKDQEFFLNTEFGLHNVREHLDYVLKNGWIVKTKYRGVDVRVTIYEDLKEQKHKNHMCKATASSFETALIIAFNKIKRYYIRVLA